MKSILGNTRKADIAFHASGLIEITSRVARTLNIKSGDVLDILCDNGSWYLYVKYHSPFGTHGSMAYKSNKRGNHFRAYSKKLCAAVLAECRQTEKAKLCVGDTVTLDHYGTALPIIIHFIIP